MKTCQLIPCIFFVIFTLIGCTSSDTNEERGNGHIVWSKVLTTGKATDFFQIDSISGAMLISYGHSFALSGGYRIIEMQTDGNIRKKHLIYAHPKHSIVYLSVKDSSVGFIRVDFDKNTFNSNLIMSYDLGTTWDTIQTPVEPIKVAILNSFMLVEGTIGAINHVFRIDTNKKWSEIDVRKLGYLDLRLLKKSSPDGKIFCLVDKEYNYRDTRLALLDARKETVSEILELSGLTPYLAPISKEDNLHVIIDEKKIRIYRFENGLMKVIDKFRVPKHTQSIENLYIGKDFFIITCLEDVIPGKTLSWISYDRGKHWMVYEQEREMKLVYNSFGRLYMTDKFNNLLQGKMAE